MHLESIPVGLITRASSSGCQLSVRSEAGSLSWARDSTAGGGGSGLDSMYGLGLDDEPRWSGVHARAAGEKRRRGGERRGRGGRRKHAA